MRKKSVKILLGTLVLSAVLITGCSHNLSTDRLYKNIYHKNIAYINHEPLERNGKFTKIKGDGTDTSTIMIYICGSDLESEGGAASMDIDEILKADLSDNINVIIQTGGASKWHNSEISADTNKRFAVIDNKLELIEDIGTVDLLSAPALADFISFCAENYTADRYDLILWNHGGGAVHGFGVDEKNPRSSLTIDKIDEALSTAKVKFDFVGFDACIMANFETALMLSRHADYLIASEEIEPGSGWYYTDFLSQISNNPSMPTPQIAKNITDDYIFTAYLSDSFNYSTLSVIDLEKLSAEVYPVFCRFFSSLDKKIAEGGYDIVAKARSESHEFAFSEYGHIDLAHFASLVSDDYSDALVEQIKSAVAYHKETPNGENANGITIYFPYKYVGDLDAMLKIYNSLNFGDEYSKFISRFSNIMAGGKLANGTSGSPFETTKCSKENTPEYWQNFGWFDENTVNDYSSLYVSTDNNLRIEKSEKGLILKLPEDCAMLNNIMLNVYADDGAGYINLGEETGVRRDKDGELIIDFNYTCTALNGKPVPFYEEHEEYIDYRIIRCGYVPAVINGIKTIDIIIYRDGSNGYVAGYRNKNNADSPLPAAKGLKSFKNGDIIDFFCDYYSYDGEYDGARFFGEPIIIGNEKINVSYERIDNLKTNVYLMISDIYNNIFYTDEITEKQE